MSEIGITQDGGTGKLKIDEEKLAKALKDNTAATRELLVGDGKETGITTKIATEVKAIWPMTALSIMRKTILTPT